MKLTPCHRSIQGNKNKYRTIGNNFDQTDLKSGLANIARSLNQITNPRKRRKVIETTHTKKREFLESNSRNKVEYPITLWKMLRLHKF